MIILSRWCIISVTLPHNNYYNVNSRVSQENKILTLATLRGNVGENQRGALCND